ncbi:MAG: hypothetical protein GY815_07525 [Gammaproteobacteria bacterium]|nr:hypothetical protein [Gammaproteobacteria bacterium]
MNLELPIIQAPMAGIQGSALTLAVSNVSGLGDFSPLRCGRNPNGCREIGAAELTRRLAAKR